MTAAAAIEEALRVRRVFNLDDDRRAALARRLHVEGFDHETDLGNLLGLLEGGRNRSGLLARLLSDEEKLYRHGSPVPKWKALLLDAEEERADDERRGTAPAGRKKREVSDGGESMRQQDQERQRRADQEFRGMSEEEHERWRVGRHLALELHAAGGSEEGAERIAREAGYDLATARELAAEWVEVYGSEYPNLQAKRVKPEAVVDLPNWARFAIRRALMHTKDDAEVVAAFGAMKKSMTRRFPVQVGQPFITDNATGADVCRFLGVSEEHAARIAACAKSGGVRLA